MDNEKINLIASKICEEGVPMMKEARPGNKPWTRKEYQEYILEHPNTKKKPGNPEWGKMKWENEQEQKDTEQWAANGNLDKAVEEGKKRRRNKGNQGITKSVKKTYNKNPEFKIFRDDTKLARIAADFLDIDPETSMSGKDVHSVEHAFDAIINFSKEDKHKFNRKNKKTHNSIKNDLVEHIRKSADGSKFSSEVINKIADGVAKLDNVEFSAFYEHMRVRGMKKPPHNVDYKRTWMLKDSSFGDTVYKQLSKTYSDEEIEDILKDGIEYANHHVGYKREGYRNVEQLKNDFIQNQVQKMREKGSSEKYINKWTQMMRGMGRQEFSAFIAFLSDLKDEEDIGTGTVTGDEVVESPKTSKIKKASAFNILAAIATLFDESKAIKEVEEDASAATTHGNCYVEEVEMVEANNVDEEEYEEPVFAEDKAKENEDNIEEDEVEEEIEEDEVEEEIEEDEIEDDIEEDEVEEEMPEEVKAGDLHDKASVLKDAEEEKVEEETSEEETSEEETSEEETSEEETSEEEKVEEETSEEVDPENLKLAGELVAIAEKLFKRSKPMTAKQKKFVSAYMTKVAKKLK